MIIIIVDKYKLSYHYIGTLLQRMIKSDFKKAVGITTAAIFQNFLN